jgi:hypothetical protein
MIVTTPETSLRLRVLTRLGFWGAVIGGLLLPWGIMLAVEVVVHQVPVARAWRSFTLHLFAPGYNFFLIGLLTAAPFVILAVLMLLHLGAAPAAGAADCASTDIGARRRRTRHAGPCGLDPS